MKRKIFQICTGRLVVGEIEAPMLFALDADGIVWIIDEYSKWSHLPELPQGPLSDMTMRAPLKSDESQIL